MSLRIIVLTSASLILTALGSNRSLAESHSSNAYSIAKKRTEYFVQGSGEKTTVRVDYEACANRAIGYDTLGKKDNASAGRRLELGYWPDDAKMASKKDFDVSRHVYFYER